MKYSHLTLNLIFSLSLVACSTASAPDTIAEDLPVSAESLETATFAGGCFWCMEKPFEKQKGVVSVVSGFSGGDIENPAYQDVASGKTAHRESVQIIFDPSVISYKELLHVFWRHVNPTDEGGQFVDRGPQYTTAIFYHDNQQRGLAEQSKGELDASGIYDVPIITPIIQYKNFYPAEEYHQDYYKKNPIRYNYYYNGSGRGQYLDSIWGKDRQ